MIKCLVKALPISQQTETLRMALRGMARSRWELANCKGLKWPIRTRIKVIWKLIGGLKRNLNRISWPKRTNSQRKTSKLTKIWTKFQRNKLRKIRVKAHEIITKTWLKAMRVTIWAKTLNYKLNATFRIWIVRWRFWTTTRRRMWYNRAAPIGFNRN